MCLAVAQYIYIEYYLRPCLSSHSYYCNTTQQQLQLFHLCITKKKLFISGLPKIHTDPEVDLRRAELERAFRKYGGPSGAVLVSIQKDSSIAFVEVASEQQADLALVEMASKYRINKARRTKHEALLEERAAKDALEKGMTKTNIDWD